MKIIGLIKNYKWKCKKMNNMKPMKTKSVELNKIWGDLQRIFLNDYRGVDNRICRELKRLDIIVYGDAHPKIRIKNKVVVLTKSSGTTQTGRTILRTIRKIYEEDERDDQSRKSK